MSREFKLPDLGEGVAEGEIVKWLVGEGDSVSEDQPMVEVMTDKATVQIPSPASGKIGKIFAKEGQTAKVGDILLNIEEAGISQKSAQENPGKPSQAITSTKTSPSIQPPRSPGVGIIATPATRKLARDLNVNLESISGSGPAGRITEEDVRKVAVTKPSVASLEQPEAVSNLSPPDALPAPAVHSTSHPLVAQTQGRTGSVSVLEERIPIHGIRKRIAEKMARSLHTTAQVTHVDEVDFTQLIALRDKSKTLAEQENVKLTFMPFIMHAATACLKEFPYFNASIDEEKQDIILKHFYNIGFAADTPNGLIVPVVKDVDKKSIFQVARDLGDLSDKARNGRIALEEIQGGTFTVTNIGTLGGVISTPIINVPEVAILGIQKIQKKPVVREDQIVIREMSFVSLSFDHRIVDGADAARFTTKLISILENPGLLMASGTRLI